MSLALLATRFVLYPQQFVYNDELIHYRVLLSIEQSRHLFTPNSLLPDTADYPGMEIATAAVHQLTGLSLHSVGIAVLAMVCVISRIRIADNCFIGAHCIFLPDARGRPGVSDRQWFDRHRRDSARCRGGRRSGKARQVSGRLRSGKEAPVG